MPSIQKSIGCVAAAMVMAVPFICRLEGNELKPYQDVAGVWSVCNGEAYVRPDVTMTQSECDARTKTEVGQYMQQVYGLTGPLPPETLAAYTSFSYNIGMSGFERSRTLRYERAGRLRDSCNAMMDWHTAGGRDCSARNSGCYGVFERRQKERDLCLKGVNNADSQ